MITKSNTINLLLITDIHNSEINLEKLKLWYKNSNKTTFDYVLCLGDVDNINNKPGKKDIDDIPGKKDQVYMKVLKFLDDFISSKIYYIPGNHDAISLFEESYALTENSKNVHKICIKLRDDLQLIGLGGSLPGFQLNSEKVMTQLWDAFPYYDETIIEKDLAPLIKEPCNKDVQTILMTHNGPSCSGTSKDLWVNPKNAVHSVSSYLFSFVEETSLNILGNFHGHTHADVGKVNIGTAQVINLSLVNFGVVKLVKLESGEWAIVKSELRFSRWRYIESLKDKLSLT